MATHEPSPARGGAFAVVRGQKPQRDARLLPIYRKVAIGSGILVSLSLLLFAYTLLFPFKNLPPLAAGLSVSKPVPLPQSVAKTTDAPSNKVLLRLQRSLLLPQPPSQRQLNSLLKELYMQERVGLAEATSGDVYNLTARFYHYKIWLDREEQLFDQEEKESWRQEMLEYWRKAKKAYEQAQQLRPAFCLPLMPWMPEKQRHQAMFLRYGSAQEAAKDMESRLAQGGN